jgi:hypothetical protein
MTKTRPSSLTPACYLEIAQAVEKQFTQYLQGSTGGTTPWLYILCTDEDILSATDEEGRTFTEAYPDAENRKCRPSGHHS